MLLKTFTYDKKTGESPRTRFVAIERLYDDHLFGIDMEDNVTKNFLFSRMSNVRNAGEFDESRLRTAVLANKDELFNLLNWNSDERNFFDQLGGTDWQLADVVNKKTGREVHPLGGGAFLLLDSATTIEITNGTDKLRLVVTVDVLSFYDSKNAKLTLDEFTRRVLGTS